MPPPNASRRRKAWSESDEEEEQQPESGLVRENSAELQESDGEFRVEKEKPNRDEAVEDED